MRNKRLEKYVFIFLIVVMAVSCRMDVGLRPDVEEGLPAKMTLDLVLPSSSDVTVSTRSIYDFESEIDELMLIMFEKNTKRKMTIDLTGAIKAGNTAGKIGAQRTYTLTSPVETSLEGPLLSGDYKVYAVANWSSPFCNITRDELVRMDATALELALAANVNFSYNVVGSQHMPMTGMSDVSILPLSEAAEGTSVNITLKRLISHIEFEFINGGTLADARPEVKEENPVFIPRSFAIYNIPKNANLFPKSSNVLESNAYGKSEKIDVIGNNKVEFFMLENVQNEVTTGISNYGDRDKWERTPSDALPIGGATDPTPTSKKHFIHAPEGATFIVVEGRYSGKSCSGNVLYTIHLGNFTSSKGASLGNFTVNRNEYHRYKIVVNGVNSIVTEAEVGNQTDGGVQSGAEGIIGSENGTQFVMDSHYETVMLKFRNVPELSNATVTAITPYNKTIFQHKPSDLAAKSGVDYKWVHFMAPTDPRSLPKYPANGVGTCDAAELGMELNALGNGQEVRNPHYLKVMERTEVMVDGKPQMKDVEFIYVVAYVDEYYYVTRPDGTPAEWTEFVNTENRILAMAPAAYVSNDGNSIFFDRYFFQLEQRSIKSTFSAKKPDVNAFGIETWNETGSVLPGAMGTGKEGQYSVRNGQFNTRFIYGSQWLGNDVLARSGFLDEVIDNKKESHVYTVARKADGNPYTAANACLTRNRDENGNGVIDPEELKWYLPTVAQFSDLWIGLDYLKEDTQLVDPSLIAGFSEPDLYLHNFFTSSDADHRVYWAIEGASSGKYDPVNNSRTDNIRCARNLKIYDQEPEISSFSSLEERSIAVLNASPSALRQNMMKGEYLAGHNERDANNRLPRKFQVAKNILTCTSDHPVPGPSFSTQGWEATCRTIVWGSSWCIDLDLPGMDNSQFEYFHNDHQFTSQKVSPKLSLFESDFTLTVRLKGTDAKIQFNVHWTGDGQAATITHLVPNSTRTEPLAPSYTFDLGTKEGQNQFHVYQIRDLADGLCSTNYYESPDKGDLGEWRVPNQRELMLMALYHKDFMPDASPTNSYASRTFFTRADLNRPQPYGYIGHVTLNSSSAYDSGGNDYGLKKTFIIRCVRDMDPGMEISEK